MIFCMGSGYYTLRSTMNENKLNGIISQFTCNLTQSRRKISGEKLEKEQRR